MDEKSFRHGRRADDFACVMTDIEERRILDVGRGRSEEGAGGAKRAREHS